MEEKIKLYGEDGNVREYNVLFTFDCEELGKSYIALENINNEEKTIEISYYNPKEEFQKFVPVINEEELKMAQEVLEQFLDSEE